MSEPTQIHSTVYRFYSTDDSPLYVGISRKGNKRMVDHASAAAWWPEVAYGWFDHYEDHQEAMAVERHLIEKLQPKYNLRHRIPTDDVRPPELAEPPGKSGQAA